MSDSEGATIGLPQTAPKSLHELLIPTLHRATSHVSTVSVEARTESDEGAHALLNQTIRRSASTSPMKSRVAITASRPTLQVTSSSSASTRTVQTTASVTSTGTHKEGASSDGSSPKGKEEVATGSSDTVPGSSRLSHNSMNEAARMSRSPSRKGKERAMEFEQEVQVAGEMATANEDASKGLRELVRRTTGLGSLSRPRSVAPSLKGASRCGALR
jgi:hypothetical protein